MKLKNKDILDKLYHGDPKVTPLTYGWLEYTKLVKDVITAEFREEIGAQPIAGSPLTCGFQRLQSTLPNMLGIIFGRKKVSTKGPRISIFLKLRCTFHFGQKR